MKIDVLGVKINTDTKIQILEQIKTALNERKSIFIATPYSESIVAAQRDQEFRTVLNSADIALPDGVGILWAAKYLKLKAKSYKPKALWQLFYSLLAIIFYPKYVRDPIPERISGSEFVWDLCKLASGNNYSIFLLGGFDQTPLLAGAKLQSQFPNLKIAGTHTGSPEEGEVVKKINESGADFLFVAFGPRKQEIWIAKNLKNLKIRLVIGVGGTFDYLAGKRPFRPKFWAIRGIEWLWRLLTQPWRAGRIIKGVFGLIWYSFKARLQL